LSAHDKQYEMVGSQPICVLLIFAYLISAVRQRMGFRFQPTLCAPIELQFGMAVGAGNTLTVNRSTFAGITPAGDAGKLHDHPIAAGSWLT
jgi:hypothetical protein